MRVGIIGCGAIAERAHMPSFRSIEGVEVYAVADQNEKALEKISTKFEVSNAFKDYRDLLSNESIDLVSICVPDFLHKQMAVDAAKAGKHILIEKPLAPTVAEATEIIRAAKSNNVKLCVVQNYRLFPAVKESRKKIEAGRIGDIVSIIALGYVFPPMQWTPSAWYFKGGGVIDVFGSHMIDIVLYLAASGVKRVFAMGGNFAGHVDTIDYAQLMLEFENKVLATVDLSWATGTQEICFDIQGTGGTLHTDVRNNHVYELHGFETPVDNVMGTTQKAVGVAKDVATGRFFTGPMEFHQDIIKGFIKSIETKSRVPISGEEGRATVAVLESAIESIRKGVPIEIGDRFEDIEDSSR